MKKSDVTCEYCGAGYRRIELSSLKGEPGSYHCLVCKRLLEIFSGATEVAYRLTVAPVRATETTGTSGLQDDP
jgi:DNA-directed RNA polymerase subunit RPC12/RpoP